LNIELGEIKSVTYNKPLSTEFKNQFYSAHIYYLSFTVNCGLCGVQEVRVIVPMETKWTNLITCAAVPNATQQGSKLIFFEAVCGYGGGIFMVHQSGLSKLLMVK
jgi:hypothetical protein